MKKLFLLLIAVLAQSALASTVDWSIQNFVGYDNELYFAVSYKIPAGKSLYYKYPGNSGYAPTFSMYSSGQQIPLQEMVWPVPVRMALASDLHTFNLKNDFTVFYKYDEEIKDQIRNRDLKLKLQWLVCADICVPESIDIEASFISDVLELSIPPRFVLSSDDLNTRLRNLPEVLEDEWPYDYDIMLSQDELGRYFLFYSTTTQFDPTYEEHNLLIPFAYSSDIKFLQEQLYVDSGNNLYGIYKFNETPTLPLTVTFLINNGKTFYATKTFSQIAPNVMGHVGLLTPVKAKITEAVKVAEKELDEMQKEQHNIALYFLLAFLGGLILNLMPCVLPVLTLKLFTLIKMRGASRRELLEHGAYYTLGILVSLGVMALIVIAIKSTGEFIGWGFQMQSPIFILSMTIILTIFALNLFGVFEFRTPNIPILNKLEGEDKGFFSGVLAVTLSTPCSAPLLGTALTFALSGSSVVLFSCMMLIGLGLATPIILAAIFPRLINVLPKPGNWMIYLKYVLGLSIVATIIWLLTIFSLQTSDYYNYLPTLKLLLVLLLIVLFFLLRKFKHKALHIASALCLLTAVGLTAHIVTSKDIELPTVVKETRGYERWTPELFNTIESDRMVFIKFTADWCLTCKMDEKLILNSDAFKQLSRDVNFLQVVADYTSSDPEVKKFMESLNIYAVPAYAIRFQDGSIKKIEGQLTVEKIKKLIQFQTLQVLP